MVAEIYDIGDVIRCGGTFTASGTAVDPSTVTARWMIDPGGSITSYVHGVDAELVKNVSGTGYMIQSQDI